MDVHGANLKPNINPFTFFYQFLFIIWDGGVIIKFNKKKMSGKDGRNIFLRDRRNILI